MKNLTAFKALIVLYKSITLKDIDKSAKDFSFLSTFADTVANDLTGFGCNASCTLCNGISCENCVYNHIKNIKYEEGKCYKDINTNIYQGILQATNRKDLKKAFQARAKHMESLLLLIK